MKYKKWVLGFLLLSLAALIIMGGTTAFIDPYFHYHPPLDGLEYPLNTERYQNDGILRNFDYDSVIIGTSMAANFKPSECDRLFGVKSVKLVYPQGSYKELDSALQRAFAEQQIKIVVRPLDGRLLIQDKDYMSYAYYPEYLTDDRLFNDIQYLLNKDIFLNASLSVLKYTAEGNKTTSLDDFGSWMPFFSFGRDAVLDNFQRPVSYKSPQALTARQKELIRENINQNVLETAHAHPETDFYFFFPPYSIYEIDRLRSDGQLKAMAEACNYAGSLLVGTENIHLFDFFSMPDIICNPDNYMDTLHYHEDINSYILRCMKSGSNSLTADNLPGYWEAVLSFYEEFDYDSVYP